MSNIKRVKSSIPFVGLHNHTTFSIFDAIGYPKDHMDFVYENGMNALAITDHGNMNGLVYQYLHAKKMNEDGKQFKPIYGIEAYFIDSIKDWKKEYEESKTKKKKESVELTVEDEEETKKYTKNVLNRRAHLILLAQNEIGLKNIFKMVSESYKSENFYRYPRIDFDMLRKYGEGVICTSACMGGPLAKEYWKTRDKGEDETLRSVQNLAAQFFEIFGDRFYGEVQWNSIPEQHAINKHVIQACQNLGIEVVSTADAHYPRPELFKSRVMYNKLGWMGKKKDYADDPIPETRADLKYELYPKNGDQMWEAYKSYSKQCGVEYDDEYIKATITRTHDIAFNVIQDYKLDTRVKLPSFVYDRSSSPDDLLKKHCDDAMAARGITSKKYTDRLKHELDTIFSRGFSKYFLTMKQISDEAQQLMLVGPSRGSAAASLVAYLLEITQVDPIKHNLLFSRFMTKDESSGYPDIDYDVSDRIGLTEHFIDKWGEDNVVPISNYNTLQLRSLIKDISKFYGISYTEVNKVTKSMVFEATPKAKAANGIKAGVYTPTFQEIMAYSSSLQRFLNDHPEVKEHVTTLQGQVRSVSRHAGGVLIADSVNHNMPLINSGGTIQTPWSEGQNVRHLEPLGFIKFDLLGLSTLQMVDECIRHILRRHADIQDPTFEDVRGYYNGALHPDVLDMSDKAVYKSIFQKGKFAGIFQFTEAGMQNLSKLAKPNNLVDLSAVTSIFRPGPLSAKVDRLYVKAKNNKKDISYLNKEIKRVTKETYGQLIFQEQIAQLAHELGKGISLDEGNKLRKLLTKKGAEETKVKREKKKIYNKFIAGCKEKGLSNIDGGDLWQTMEFFSGYGFNLAHATGYSIISFQCAWLAHYFPAEWMAAFLDKEPEKRKAKAVNLAKSFGYKIKRVDINNSGRTWEISKDGKTLIQPLTAIKGLGDKAIDQILINRPFRDVEDFLFNENVVYSKLNKKALDVLCRSQALNELVDDRFTGLKSFWSAIAVDRPRTKKELNKNIDLYKEEGDFSLSEKICYISDLTGVYPLELVLKEDMLDKFAKLKIPALGDWDGKLKIAWFIPKEVIVKETKHGKTYWILRVIDSTSKENDIKCWGIRPLSDKISLNKPYIAKLEHNDKWGFSSRSLKHNFKLLT
tara:strand:- start:22414 stop:25836 length:3423 start_codon:yes stop_codon:yes gene_type:complete